MSSLCHCTAACKTVRNRFFFLSWENIGKTWGENIYSMLRSSLDSTTLAKRKESVTKWKSLGFFCPLSLSIKFESVVCDDERMGHKAVQHSLFSFQFPLFNAIKLLKYQITAISFLGWSQNGWTPHHSDGEIPKHEVFLELDAISHPLLDCSGQIRRNQKKKQDFVGFLHTGFFSKHKRFSLPAMKDVAKILLHLLLCFGLTFILRIILYLMISPNQIKINSDSTPDLATFHNISLCVNHASKYMLQAGIHSQCNLYK